MAQHDTNRIVRRFRDGVDAFERARKLIQRESWGDAENALRLAATQSIGALEWALKSHLRHPTRTEKMRPEEFNSLKQPTFEVLVRLLKTYGEPIPDAQIIEALFGYRSLRNEAEHGGVLPSISAVQEALKSIGSQIGNLLSVEVEITHGNPLRLSARAPASHLPPRPNNVTGRRLELEKLRNVLQRTLSSNQGGMILVGGCSGTGKTHLCREVIHYAATAGFDVVATACEPFQGGTTLFPIKEVIRQLSGHSNAATAFDSLYPESTAGTAIASLAVDVNVELSVRRDAYLATFGNIIYQRFPTDTNNRQRALLIFLDDMEWSEASTIDAILCLRARFSEGPVIIVGSYRTDIVAASPDHSITPLLRLAARHPDQITLQEIFGFGKSDFGFLAQDLLGGPIEFPQSVIDRLYRETEGNPLFLREVLRSLADTDLDLPAIARCEDGVWRTTRPIGEWKIPATVEEAIESRLRYLSHAQREELEHAAVVGRSFAYGLWIELLDRGEAELDEVIEELLRFEVIREIDGTSDVSFEFTHGKIRDVIYSAIPRFKKSRMHKHVAEMLIKIRASIAVDGISGMIGRHLFLGGNLADAREHLILGAREAASSVLALEAAELFALALQACEKHGFDPGFGESQLRLAYSDSLRQNGRYAEALAVLGQAVLKSGDSGLLGQIYNALGDLYWLVGNEEDALLSYRSCQSFAEEHNDHQLLLEVYADLCEFHDRESERMAGRDDISSIANAQESVRYLRGQLALAASNADPRMMSRTMRNNAKFLRKSGDLEGALCAYEDALKHADPRYTDHSVLISYAKTLRFVGRRTEAEAICRRVLDWGCRTGSTRTEAIAHQYLGLLAMEAEAADQHDAARIAIERALSLHQEIGYERGLRETRMLLGEWHIRRRNNQAGLVSFREALELDHDVCEKEILDIVVHQLRAANEDARANLIGAALACYAQV